VQAETVSQAWMPRKPEPELMAGEEQAYAYSWADFTELNSVMVARFQSAFPSFRSGVALDLGCGTADMSIRFAEGYPDLRLVGVDGADAMLAYADRAIAGAFLSDRIELQKWVLPDTVLESRTYDAVIANNLLHHLSDPAILWRTAAKCSKAGAPVMVMDLRRPQDEQEARSLVARYAHRALPILKDDFFRSLCAAYTVGEVRDQIASFGLRGFQVEEVGDCQWLAWGTARPEASSETAIG
jgi:SAM-dependent methyltransferase